MQDQDAIYSIVARWYGFGQITSDERATLKAEYLRQLEAEPPCTICPNFWSDVLHFYRNYFKTLNTPIMSARKYMIANNSYLQLPGDSMIYVNEGVSDESRMVLTDEMAERFLELYPSYDQLIVLNPAYGQDAETIAGSEESFPEATSDDQDSEDPEGNDEDLDALQSKYDTLKVDYDSIKAERDQLKADHEALNVEHKATKDELSATKGKLTRATKKIGELSKPVEPTPATATTVSTSTATAPIVSEGLTPDATV